jgi:tetratricopeptide (TPR) repeat protein
MVESGSPMVAGLEILCAAALVLPIPLPTGAPGASQDPATAEALFEAGRTAYRLGHFQDAIDAWTRAYAEDPLPSFLFNIALAHQRQYELTGSVEHLHQGKAVLERFIAAAAEDPDVDIAPAKRLMVEIDELLAAAEAKGASADPATETGERPATDARPPVDRTRTMAGAATMAAGGALVIVGSVLAITFGVRARRWHQAEDHAIDEDADARRAFTDEGLGNPSANADAYDEFSIGRCTLSDEHTPAAVPCREVVARFRDNARGSDGIMGLGLGLSGLGVVAVVVGAVVYARGRRPADRTARRSIRVAPSALGLQISGRF